MPLGLPIGRREEIAILAREKGVFAGPYSCLPYLHDAVTIRLYAEYANLWALYQPPLMDLKKSPDFDKPKMAIWCDANRAERNAIKFASIMNQLESRMGIEAQTSVRAIADEGSNEKDGAFIADVPPIWFKSPVLLSAYAIFMRLSIRMKKGEAFDDFMARMMDKTESDFKEASLLRMANKLGNIQALIDHSLPCMNREGLSDYLLGDHGRHIAWYHAASDAQLPMKEEALLKLRIDGRKFELSRLELDSQ
jgi:hypothetical protein